MASISDVQHRFANKLAGKNGCISSSSCRYEGRNFYSYSTIFGQWLDMEKNVCVIFDGKTSTSSSKHKLGKWCFPDDVHVFPLDFGYKGYYGWRNCNLVGEYQSKDEDFKEYHRMQMIDHYVERIYNQIAAINGGKTKGLENVDFSAWGYVEELCSLYKDTTINKYLKTLKHVKPITKNGERVSTSLNHKKVNAEIDAKKTLVKLLKDGERDVETLTDSLFGKGTFKTYWDYCARYRKSADKRAKIETLCKRLGIGSPYVSYRGYQNRMSHEMSADDIRKLTAKERVELHFKALAYNEWRDGEYKREKKAAQNYRNAFAWITGSNPKEKSWGVGYEPEVYVCRNMFTGEVYDVKENISFDYRFKLWGLDFNISFDYDKFRKAENKEEWIRSFYAKCKEVNNNNRVVNIFKRFGESVYTDQLIDYSTYRIFVDNDVLKSGTTEEEHALCVEFIEKWNAILHDNEARYRAEQLARKQREEEERKEREYMEQVKQEQIVECLKDGSEGCRNLWRKHLSDLYDAEASFKDASVVDKDGDFFYGGNVLMRLNLNKDTVETSKRIRIPVEICKKMWKIVSKWHENPSCFKSMQIDTKGSGKYIISSYENDILTAGCHRIAYTEMERMYNEIINA